MSKDFPYTIKEYYESDSDGNPVSGKKKSCVFFNSEDIHFVEERQVSYKKTKYICASCMGKLYIAGGPDNYFRPHFRHRYMKEVQECCAYENSTLSLEEVTRIVFNKRKESLKHKALKNNILAKLEQVGYDCELEQVTRSSENPREWRKADILAKDRKSAREIAVEVQVSYNFLNTILGRGDFYPKQKKYLIWIVEEFNYDLYQQDILFSSPKRNIFVYNDVAKKESEETGKFYLDCYYVTYKIKDDKVIPCDKFEHKLVCFPDDFTFADEYKLYAVDTDVQEEELKNELKKKKEEEAKEREEERRREIEEEKNKVIKNIEELINKEYPFNHHSINDYIREVKDYRFSKESLYLALDEFYEKIFILNYYNNISDSKLCYLMLYRCFRDWVKENEERVFSVIQEIIANGTVEEASDYVWHYYLLRIVMSYHDNVFKLDRRINPFNIGWFIGDSFFELGKYNQLKDNKHLLLRMISPIFKKLVDCKYPNYKGLNNYFLNKNQYYHLYERNLEMCSINSWKQNYYELKEKKEKAGLLFINNSDLDDLYEIIFSNLIIAAEKEI